MEIRTGEMKVGDRIQTETDDCPTMANRNNNHTEILVKRVGNVKTEGFWGF